MVVCYTSSPLSHSYHGYISLPIALTLGLEDMVSSLFEGGVEMECVSVMGGGVGRNVMVTLATGKDHMTLPSH